VVLHRDYKSGFLTYNHLPPEFTFMQYIIAGICIVFCIVVIVFGLKVLKESRKMEPKKKDTEDEDEIQF
jgi:hypothetical protein